MDLFSFSSFLGCYSVFGFLEQFLLVNSVSLNCFHLNLHFLSNFSFLGKMWVKFGLFGSLGMLRSSEIWLSETGSRHKARCSRWYIYDGLWLGLWWILRKQKIKNMHEEISPCWNKSVEFGSCRKWHPSVAITSRL